MAAPAVTLSAPYTLFPLSLPLHQSRAKDREGSSYRACYASPVESRKRKRLSGHVELATSVDGEGLNIYDVRATKTISSYALQPATRFSCAPASSILKGAKSGTFRRTYASISAPKRELMCWEETVGAEDVALEDETPIKHFSTGTGSKADIIYLEDLSIQSSRAKKRGEETQSGLLAVFADRRVRFFSEDLATEHYDYVVPSKQADATVVYAASTSIATARKALFKTRPGLDSLATEGNVEEILLLLVTKSRTTFTVRLLAVSTAAGSRRPREVLSVALPSVEGVDDTQSTFSIHFATGTLYRLSHARLVTYDIAADIPKVVSVLPIREVEDSDAAPSLLRISASTVLVATASGISLYDTKFSSLQASAPVQASTPSSMTMSRSSTPASTTDFKTGNVFLATYMQDLDLAIGYSQSGIVGIQFTRPRGTVDRPKKGGLLIDSLCRGIRGLDVQSAKKKSKGVLSTRLETQRKQAEQTVATLAAAKEAGDVTQFEQVFAAYAGFEFANTQKAIEEDTVMLNGEHMSQALVNHQLNDHMLEIPESAHKPLRTDFVGSVLSLIFTVEPARSSAEDDSMTLGFFAPVTLRYLLESGNFSTISLPAKNSLVQALIKFDSSLRVLQWFLSLLGELSITEVMRSIQLTISPPANLGDTISPLIFEINRNEVLRSALIRLASFPNTTIISALKTLPSSLLLQLISLLELELISGENTYADPTRTLGLEDIRLVADLLTAAVDAVGLSGLLLTETSTILDELSTDVEAALTTVEEAASLKGLLDELFRHVNWDSLPAETPLNTTPTPNSTILTLEANNKKQAQAATKKARKLERQEAARTGIPAPPTPARKSLPAPKSATAAQKLRRARSSRKARDNLLQRLNTKRAVGHKKQLKGTGLGKKQLRKQDRPVALRKALSSLLPLGLKGGVVDPVVGIEVTDKPKAGQDVKAWRSKKREYWREGLSAGVYSVETMVV